MAQYIDGQSISVPSFCRAKTSKNNSEALFRCKGCFVDFSRPSHKIIISRGIRMSRSQTSICSARRDILLLSAAAALPQYSAKVDLWRSDARSPREPITIGSMHPRRMRCLLRCAMESSILQPRSQCGLLPCKGISYTAMLRCINGMQHNHMSKRRLIKQRCAVADLQLCKAQEIPFAHQASWGLR